MFSHYALKVSIAFQLSIIVVTNFVVGAVVGFLIKNMYNKKQAVMVSLGIIGALVSGSFTGFDVVVAADRAPSSSRIFSGEKMVHMMSYELGKGCSSRAPIQSMTLVYEGTSSKIFGQSMPK